MLGSGLVGPRGLAKQSKMKQTDVSESREAVEESRAQTLTREKVWGTCNTK